MIATLPVVSVLVMVKLKGVFYAGYAVIARCPTPAFL
jgi:hypothetical protein